MHAMHGGWYLLLVLGEYKFGGWEHKDLSEIVQFNHPLCTTQMLLHSVTPNSNMH